jgi:hypothetical protein
MQISLRLTITSLSILYLLNNVKPIQQCTKNKLVDNPINFIHMFWARADTEFKSTEPATIVTFHYQNRRDMGNGQFEDTVAFRLIKKPEFRASPSDLGYYYIVVSVVDGSGNFVKVKTFLRGKISSDGQKWINGTDGGANDLSSVVNRLTGLQSASQEMSEKYCGRFLKFEYEYYYFMLKNYYSTPQGRQYALSEPQAS